MGAVVVPYRGAHRRSGAGYGNGPRNLEQLLQSVCTAAAIIVPTSAAFTPSFPAEGGKPSPDFLSLPGDLPSIADFKSDVRVMASLAKPRKLDIVGTDGKLYSFLCKPKDDLRKDCRVMELNSVINKLLSKDPHARRRRLKIRTYGVVPLNEEYGLLEWVRARTRSPQTASTQGTHAARVRADGLPCLDADALLALLCHVASTQVQNTHPYRELVRALYQEKGISTSRIAVQAAWEPLGQRMRDDKAEKAYKVTLRLLWRRSPHGWLREGDVGCDSLSFSLLLLSIKACFAQNLRSPM